MYKLRIVFVTLYETAGGKRGVSCPINPPPYRKLKSPLCAESDRSVFRLAKLHTHLCETHTRICKNFINRRRTPPIALLAFRLMFLVALSALFIKEIEHASFAEIIIEIRIVTIFQFRNENNGIDGRNPMRN